MKSGIAIVMILVLVVAGGFAAAAWGSSITTQIIKDASDGTINGHYTAAQVRAALAVVENNPAYSQYSDIAGVLQDYLASLSHTSTPKPPPTPTTTSSQPTPIPTASSPPTLQSGQLDYTGGRPLLIFAAGGALLAAGAVLRRRSAGA